MLLSKMTIAKKKRLSSLAFLSGKIVMDIQSKNKKNKLPALSEDRC